MKIEGYYEIMIDMKIEGYCEIIIDMKTEGHYEIIIDMKIEGCCEIMVNMRIEGYCEFIIGSGHENRGILLICDSGYDLPKICVTTPEGYCFGLRSAQNLCDNASQKHVPVESRNPKFFP